MCYRIHCDTVCFNGTTKLARVRIARHDVGWGLQPTVLVREGKWDRQPSARRGEDARGSYHGLCRRRLSGVHLTEAGTGGYWWVERVWGCDGGEFNCSSGARKRQASPAGWKEAVGRGSMETGGGHVRWSQRMHRV